MNFLEELLDSNFMPHGHCYFWRPEIVWTNAVSDSIIALAYLTIPFSLVYIIRIRKDINFKSLAVLFAIFILGCGSTHIMDVINIWSPFYHFDSFLRVVTALASIGTAIVLVKITPRILLIPNPEEFKKLNNDLKEQLNQLEKKEIELLEREALLLETQEIGNIGSYKEDLLNYSLETTPQLNVIYGFNRHDSFSIEKLFKAIHEEDRERVLLARNNAIQNNIPFNVEYRILRSDKTIRYVRARAKVHFDENNVPLKMIGTVIDLTEEKEAADKLLSVQTELMQIKEFVFLAESLPQLVWTTDKNGDVDYFNQNWFSFTGQSKKEALAWGWASMIHHDDLNQTLELWRRALREENLFQAEYRIQKYDGTFRWFLGKGVPMKDENNKIKKWIGTCTDIHDLKTYEEVLLKSNNELSKTNKDLDNFVYTASHDLKAPVANLEGLLNMMKKKVGNEIESEGKNILNLMETSVNRFKSTIHDLTEITKINKKIQEDIQEVSFEEAVKEVLEDLRTTIHETGAEFKYDFRVSQIYFSKINFRSIISNLLGNAIKYRSPDRKPSIEIATHQEGRWCILTVKDNGIGFDITKKDKVFAMFRRLHDHVEGTGLGLYIVKRIIEDAGGKIEADSKIGEGSLFKLYFPI